MKTIEIEITDNEFEKLSQAAEQCGWPIEEEAQKCFSFGLLNNHQDLHPEIFEMEEDNNPRETDSE